MHFGAHVSVAGGLENGPKNAAALGCEVFQMFTRPPQGGPAPKITPETVAAFRAACDEGGLKKWVIHAPYILNFASAQDRTRAMSASLVRGELDRGTQIGASYVMFHPGSAKDVGDAEGVRLCVEGIKRVLDGYAGTTKLLIEISAGAGAVIGDQFEEVAALLEGVGHPELGVCFDTAHAFASGYDLRTPEAVDETFKKFDQTVGLEKLRMSHCNDSKVDLGAKKDRHEHLGMGYIGLAGFQAIIKHPKLQHLDLFLETEHDDILKRDLAILKAMRDGGSIPHVERAAAAETENGDEEAPKKTKRVAASKKAGTKKAASKK